MDELDLQINQILKDDKKPPRPREDLLRITAGAFNKMMSYAKIVSRLAGSGMECYGYLLKEKEGLDDLIVDAYFADHQEANSAYVRVTEEGVYSASQSIEPLGYEIAGWWHSHGSMQPFHSGTDVENFKNILHSIAPRTLYKLEEADFVIDNDKGIVIVDNYKFFDLDIEEFAQKKPKILKKVKRDPFAFSIVVNQYGHYYREKITKTYDSLNKRYRVNAPTHPTVEVVALDNDVTFSISEIEHDVRNKITFGVSSFRRKHASQGFRKSKYGTEDRFHNEWSLEDNARLWSGQEVFKKSADKSFKRLLKKFKRTIKKYDSAKGVHSDGLKKFAAYDGDCPFAILAQLTTFEESPANYQSSHKLKNHLQKYNLGKFTGYDENLSFDELKNLLCLQFILDLSKSKNETQAIDKIIEDYEKKAQDFQTNFSLIVTGVKAMTNYAMKFFTDYSGESQHQYKKVMMKVLDDLANGSTLEDAIQIKSDNVVIKKDLMLKEEKYKIVSKLTNYAARDVINGVKIPRAASRFYKFVKEFGELYSENSDKLASSNSDSSNSDSSDSDNFDKYIETKLLPVLGVKKEQIVQYNDSNYGFQTLDSEIDYEPRISVESEPIVSDEAEELESFSFKKILKKYFGRLSLQEVDKEAQQ
ncbi:Mov34/MPN/PAD-1 family protein [Candidatus Woesearchaeota archaeon]|jgi:proteasome lid subunit RPN8/RPN11|nr:Mov34/MPN/PAD-1 family protein [Candidatus Woesearchaeota archaeon]MBT6519048.1 Mov34/MPN/PAD-1 family protein [Candidatus Woesearchaeota archaeon]